MAADPGGGSLRSRRPARGVRLTFVAGTQSANSAICSRSIPSTRHPFVEGSQCEPVRSRPSSRLPAERLGAPNGVAIERPGNQAKRTDERSDRDDPHQKHSHGRGIMPWGPRRRRSGGRLAVSGSAPAGFGAAPPGSPSATSSTDSGATFGTRQILSTFLEPGSRTCPFRGARSSVDRRQRAPPAALA